MDFIGLLLPFTISGVGGLSLLLESLYGLFQEGRISKALYNELAKAILKKVGAKNLDDLDIPIDFKKCLITKSYILTKCCV